MIRRITLYKKGLQKFSIKLFCLRWRTFVVEKIICLFSSCLLSTGRRKVLICHFDRSCSRYDNNFCQSNILLWSKLVSCFYCCGVAEWCQFNFRDWSTAPVQRKTSIIFERSAFMSNLVFKEAMFVWLQRPLSCQWREN